MAPWGPSRGTVRWPRYISPHQVRRTPGRTGRPTLPAGAQDRIDPAELVRALRESGAAADDAELLSMSYAPIGVGHTADSFRVELRWSRQGAGPSSLVAKIPSVDEKSAGTAKQLGAYERECRFYELLAPRTKVTTPRFLGAMEYDGERTGLLLEDLSGRARPGNQLSDAPLEQVVLARRQLVELQAPYWGNEATGASPWLHRRLGVPIPAIAERMARSWATSRERIAGGFSREELAVVDRFVERAEDWTLSLDGPFSLVHHDFRFDNLLFSDSEVFVVDWQTVGWGPPMFDVAYLLGPSFGREVRTRCEREQIHRHMDELAEAGVTDWTFDEAWEAYRKASFAVLLMLVPPTGSVRRTDRGDAMFSRLIQYGAQQVIDLDALEFLS